MKRWSLPLVTLVAGVAVGAFLAGTLLQGQAPLAPAPPRELTSYRDVVKRVLPAVVSITSKGKPGKKGKLPDDVPEEFRKHFEQQPDDGTVGFGSGFIIDPRGVVITNNHVVEGADSVEVVLGDGRKFTSRDVKADAKADLAVIRLDPKAVLPALELGDSDAMEVGDRVLAVGAPFGLTGSVTSGIVSAKGRSLKMNVYEDYLQTDAAINPGNSGGPLVNMDGRVIGVTSAIKSRTGGFQGIGLAISSNLVKNIVDQLQRDGVVRRGYLGAAIDDLTDRELGAKVGVPPGGGVVVTKVFDGTPAAKGGLREGDVIVSVNGKAVRDGRELQQVVGSQPLGKAAQVGVMRQRQLRTLDVVIEEQPADFGSTPAPRESRFSPPGPDSESRATVPPDKLGMDVADLTPEAAEKMGFPPKTVGALVVNVETDSAAGRAGLKPGQLITRIDKIAVRGVTDLKAALDATALEGGVLVRVTTPQGDSSYVLLRKN